MAVKSLLDYHHDPNFFDSYTWENGADPSQTVQTAHSGSEYTVRSSVGILEA